MINSHLLKEFSTITVKRIYFTLLVAIVAVSCGNDDDSAPSGVPVGLVLVSV